MNSSAIPLRVLFLVSGHIVNRMPASDEDFLSSMFSQEPSVGPMASTQDFYSNQTAFSNPQNPPDMMLALQPSGTRQTLLESQLKIQQLQQLQQLQQQIFQQQVS